MRALTGVAALSAILAVASALPAGPPAAPLLPATGDGVFDRELRQVVEGVYVAVRPDVLRQPVDGNITFVVCDRDVVVVDSGGGVAAAENALRLLRQVTDKPVRYVVNTHWHGDHVLGNQVFLKAYPGAEVVSHARTAASMTGENIGLERFQPQLEGMIATLEKGLDSGLDDGGAPLAPERRARWQGMVPDLKAALAEYRRARIARPTLTFEDGFVLHRGDREIQVRYLGRGNTDGDVVVWLPIERVAIGGDLVVLPLPYGFGSYPTEWIETLDRLVALDYRYLVPGHGDVQTDAACVRRLQALIGKLRDDVAGAVATGASLEEARRAIDLGALTQSFTGGDARLQSLLDAWFVQPLSLSAYRESRGEPIVQGQQG